MVFIYLLEIQSWRIKPTDFEYEVVSNNENNAKLTILIFSLRCNNAILFPHKMVFLFMINRKLKTNLEIKYFQIKKLGITLKYSLHFN